MGMLRHDGAAAVSAVPRADSRITISTTIYHNTGDTIQSFKTHSVNAALVLCKKLIRNYDRRYPHLKPHTSKTVIQPNF